MFRARVLIIDDDPVFRNLVVAMLRRDYFVSVASEGSEGYYKALEHPPDVAVFDMKMAGWDGLRTLKAFRGNAFLAQTPIVILTADASKETVLAAIHAGANDYMIKSSFTKEAFVKKIRLLARPASPQATAPARRVDPSSAVPVPPPPAAPPPAALAAADQRGLQAIIDDWE